MFKFKLQKVLDYRENVEKQGKEDFANKLMKFNNIKTALNEMILKKKETRDKNYISKFKTSNDFIVFQRYVGYLDNSIEEKRNMLSEAERILERARLELIKNTKDKKIIEILKESAFEEYIDNDNRVEQKKLDDIAINSYIKLLKGGER
ncbi:MAG: flagellar export protein FliJ [Clostridium sp.]